MFKFFAKTINGKYKDTNDDCFLINSFVSQDVEYKKQTKESNFLAAIADGVGSSKYGNLASKILFENLSKNSKIISHQIILNVIKNTNIQLFNSFKSKASTVFSLVYGYDDKVIIYHVGDTRVYKLTANNKLVLLTNDHTYVQKLIDDGIITDSMRYTHPSKNKILKAIGNNNDIDIDIYKNSFEKGEKLIITSDGIHDYIEENDLTNILTTSKNDSKNIDTLILKAKENHSKDDLTVTIVSYE